MVLFSHVGHEFYKQYSDYEKMKLRELSEDSGKSDTDSAIYGRTFIHSWLKYR